MTKTRRNWQFVNCSKMLLQHKHNKAASVVLFSAHLIYIHIPKLVTTDIETDTS